MEEKEQIEGPYSINERVTYLEQVVWLRDCRYEDLAVIARFLRVAEYAQGLVVCAEGEKRQCLSIIGDGRVRVYKKDGKEHKELATLNAGKTFGEMSLLDGYPTSASVVAVNDLFLLELPMRNYEDLMDAHPRVALQLLTAIARMMSARLRSTSGRLAQFLP